MTSDMSNTTITKMTGRTTKTNSVTIIYHTQLPAVMVREHKLDWIVDGLQQLGLVLPQFSM